MATKPIIASPRGEYDARTLVLGDLANVNVWPDVSPLGTNDLAHAGSPGTYQAVGGAGTPWSATLPAVKLDNLPGVIDSYSFPTAFGGSGTPITLFVVAQVTQLDPQAPMSGGGMAFWGTTDGIAIPVGVYLIVAQDGSVQFILGRNGAQLGSQTASVPGLVKPGDRIILTARRLEFPQNVGVNAGPTTLRLNGVEVASTLSSGWVDFWFSPRFHRANLPGNLGFPPSVDGHDGLLAHALCYQSAASDAEILQMEAFLGEVWGIQFGTIWVAQREQLPISTAWTGEGVIPALKPAIVGLEVEWDAREITGVDDLDPVVTWPDTSGQGNDLTAFNTPIFELTGWPENSGPSVRITEPGSNGFTFGGGAAFVGSEYTFFFVVQPFALTAGNILMGGSSFNSQQIIEVLIKLDGSLLFGQFTNETGVDVVTTAAGLVSPNETVIVTCRHSNTTGKIIRLNGTQVGVSASGTNDLTAWPNPQWGMINQAFFSDDFRTAWTSGYSSAASDAEILEMEAFLNQQFFGTPPLPPTDWQPA